LFGVGFGGGEFHDLAGEEVEEFLVSIFDGFDFGWVVGDGLVDDWQAAGATDDPGIAPAEVAPGRPFEALPPLPPAPPEPGLGPPPGIVADNHPFSYFWISDRWPADTRVAAQVWGQEVSPLLSWFRGAMIEVNQQDARFLVHGYLDINRREKETAVLPGFEAFKGFSWK
jgi:hypothetical protein